MFGNLSRTDIERLLDEYKPLYYKWSDFKDNAKRRLFDGAKFNELYLNTDTSQRNAYNAFQMELKRFEKWVAEKNL